MVYLIKISEKIMSDVIDIAELVGRVTSYDDFGAILEYAVESIEWAVGTGRLNSFRTA